MKAKKLPSGSYRVRMSIGKDASGKYTYKSFTAPTAKEAERMAYEWEYNQKSIVPIEKTLKQALQEFNDSREYTLSPRTVREYDRYRESAFKSIENLRVCDINQKVVQSWVNECARVNSPKTVRNKYDYLSVFLKSNDIEIKCHLPQKKTVQYHIVTKEEFANILEATENNPSLNLAIKLAVFIPARRSEICAINPKTDVKGNLLTINKAKVKDTVGCWVIKDTKTLKSTRTVEMPSDIIKQLKTVPLYDNPDALFRAFKSVVDKLGYSDMRFHDLRHFGATLLHDMNIPEKETMHRGGWSSLNTLMNIYVHYNPDTAKEAAKAINNLYDSFKE